MLHTVNKSPFEHNGLATCLRYARPGSAVLLIEDGVYAATRDTAVAKQIVRAACVSAFIVISDRRISACSMIGLASPLLAWGPCPCVRSCA